mmetsp:Transcript_1798/g.4980  ORF Transcript_1798/g.4980 Transcript_1798/m.4980 type:complete len:250 (+) Transcript_1798:1151-1900(+)
MQLSLGVVRNGTDPQDRLPRGSLIIANLHQPTGRLGQEKKSQKHQGRRQGAPAEHPSPTAHDILAQVEVRIAATHGGSDDLSEDNHGTVDHADCATQRCWRDFRNVDRNSLARDADRHAHDDATYHERPQVEREGHDDGANDEERGAELNHGLPSERGVALQPTGYACAHGGCRHGAGDHDLLFLARETARLDPGTGDLHLDQRATHHTRVVAEEEAAQTGHHHKQNQSGRHGSSCSAQSRQDARVQCF